MVWNCECGKTKETREFCSKCGISRPDLRRLGEIAFKVDTQFEFAPDAYRDNEEERLHTYAYAERLNGGDGVEDFEREELEQIITLAKHAGASTAMIEFAKAANDHLDNEDEREGTLEMERAFNDYWGDTGSHSEESYRQDMNDAGRGHLLS